jgi:hypothetical protein
MTEIARRNIIVEYEVRADKFIKDQSAIAKESKGLAKVFDSTKESIAELTDEKKKSNQESKKLTQSIKGQAGEVDKLADKTETATKNTGFWNTVMEKMGGRINGVIKDLKEFRSGLVAKATALRASSSGLTGASKALQIFKIALASTGIGLLVIALGTLVTFFTKTQRGADFVSKVFDGLSAAVSVVIDRIAGFGEGLTLIFSGQYAAGAKKLRDAVSGVGAEIAKEAKAASNLRGELNALTKAENAFILTQAEAKKKVEELRAEAAKLRATDKAASAARLKEAEEIQNKVYDEEIRLAKERARILQEQVALGESMDDEIRTANEATAEATRLEGEKFARSRELIMQQQELNNAAAAERKRIEEEAAREAERLAKEQLEAERSIRERRIALIKDDLRREIEAVKESAKQQKEAAKGSDELIAEQRLLIEKQALQEIEKLREEHNKKIEEEELKLIQAIATQREEAAVRQQAADERERERNVQGAILSVQRQVLAKTKTEEEGAVAIARIQIAALEEQIKAAEFQVDEKIKLQQELVNAQIALEQSLTAATKEEQEERREAGEKAIQSVLTILEASFDREADRIAKSIQLQEKRVEDVTAIASAGNAELLQLEEQRLRKLQEQQAAAVKKQRALQAIQIAGNATLAVSEGIVAVIAGFKKGPIAGIASALALAATLASAIAGIRSALSDVPAFREGVDVFQGKGTATSDSNLVRVSKGERIVDAKTNKGLVGIGVNNDNILKVASMGMQALRAPSISQQALIAPGPGKSNQDYKDLKREIKRQTLAIQNLGVSAIVDDKGFTALLGKRNKFKERRKNLLR